MYLCFHRNEIKDRPLRLAGDAVTFTLFLTLVVFCAREAAQVRRWHSEGGILPKSSSLEGTVSSKAL